MLVKNCGERMHVLVVEKDSIGDLLKLVHDKKSTAVQQKALDLLQCWKAGIKYGPNADALGDVIKQLKVEGII